MNEIKTVHQEQSHTLRECRAPIRVAQVVLSYLYNSFHSKQLARDSDKVSWSYQLC